MPQSEANEAVSAALEAWVDSLPMDEPGGKGILGEWIAVVCMVDINDGVPGAQYYLAMRGGNMLPHTAEGLLRQGLTELASDE